MITTLEHVNENLKAYRAPLNFTDRSLDATKSGVKKTYPAILSTFGVKKGKATGPSVLAALKKMEPRKITPVAKQFLYWSKAHNKHFNRSSIDEIKSFCFKL